MAGSNADSAQGARGPLRGALSLARDNLRLLVLLVCTIVFLALLGEVLEGEILRLDTLAYRFFVETLRSDALTPVVEAVTSLASVVVLEPEVVILDEPTSGLDYRECMTVMETVREMAEQGSAVIMVCHDMEVVSDFAERLVVMADGCILAAGPTMEVFNDASLMRRARVKPPQVVELAAQLARDVSGAFAGVTEVSGIVDTTAQLVHARNEEGSHA